MKRTLLGLALAALVLGACEQRAPSVDDVDGMVDAPTDTLPIEGEPPAPAPLGDTETPL